MLFAFSGASWSVPAPENTKPLRGFAAATERRISSSDSGQLMPMPRCAVSIASATPKPKIPEMLAERDGAVPVHRRIEPGIGIGQRIGDDMRGGKSDAVQRRAHIGRKIAGRRHREIFQLRSARGSAMVRPARGRS